MPCSQERICFSQTTYLSICKDKKDFPEGGGIRTFREVSFSLNADHISCLTSYNLLFRKLTENLLAIILYIRTYFETISSVTFEVYIVCCDLYRNCLFLCILYNFRLSIAGKFLLFTVILIIFFTLNLSNKFKLLRLPHVLIELISFNITFCFKLNCCLCRSSFLYRCNLWSLRLCNSRCTIRYGCTGSFPMLTV